MGARVPAAVMALLAALLSVAGCGSRAAPALRLSACTVQGVAARCGSLSVPENRLTGEGRRIALRVVVVPAQESRPRPDPIVYFAGGPGDAASDRIGDAVAVRGMRDRDLVFVDQRGTGGSHRLTCPSPVPDDDRLGAYVAACLRTLDGDPRFYTSSMAADDVADVLSSLGYERANLYGGSYGATMAQVFQRRHPGMVRTMTLLGGTLLDVPIFERIPLTSQAALDDVFARCRADASCSAAFPRLDADWQRLLADLRAAPLTVPPELTPTGQPFVLTPELFAADVHQLLLSASTAAQIPWAVHTLSAATDRVSAVVTVSARIGDPLGGGDAFQVDAFQVMAYATRCNEDWARFDPEEVAAHGQGSYYTAMALTNARYWQQACALFPSAGKAAEIGGTAVSDTPVLLFNGTADPQDPPSNVAGAARQWPHSALLVEPHQSHSTSQWQCPEGIVDAFIESGSVDGLQTDCLTTVQPPSLVTSG